MLITTISEIAKNRLQLSFSDEEIRLIENSFIPKIFEKGEMIIEQDTVCTSVYFVNKGGVRFFYYKEDGTEITECFHFSNSFMSAYESFLTGKPTAENAEALEETELLEITKTNLQFLYNKIPHFEKVSHSIVQDMYVDLEKRIMSIHNQSAEERYLHLLQSENEEIIKRISLKHISSYLGISPETLSRVRRKLSQK